MATSERVVGISISERAVQAVEVGRNGPQLTLHALDEWENPFPPDGAGEGQGGVEQFTELLSAFMKVNQVKARKVSVALDTGLLFIIRIPIEAGLTRSEIGERLIWELSQYFPGAGPKDFISDITTLTEVEGGKWKEVLSVSVKRASAMALRKILSQLVLELSILDADHFSADTALRLNYPDTYRKQVALVGIKENRVDVSVLRNGTLATYRYFCVQSNKEIIEQVGALSRETQGIQSITTYGPYLDNDLLVQIRRGAALLVEALNPLRHLTISDTLRLADHLSMPSYRFASAVGVALRRD